MKRNSTSNSLTQGSLHSIHACDEMSEYTPVHWMGRCILDLSKCQLFRLTAWNCLSKSLLGELKSSHSRPASDAKQWLLTTARSDILALAVVQVMIEAPGDGSSEISVLKGRRCIQQKFAFAWTTVIQSCPILHLQLGTAEQLAIVKARKNAPFGSFCTTKQITINKPQDVAQSIILKPNTPMMVHGPHVDAVSLLPHLPITVKRRRFLQQSPLYIHLPVYYTDHSKQLYGVDVMHIDIPWVAKQLDNKSAERSFRHGVLRSEHEWVLKHSYCHKPILGAAVTEKWDGIETTESVRLAFQVRILFQDASASNSSITSFASTETIDQASHTYCLHSKFFHSAMAEEHSKRVEEDLKLWHHPSIAFSIRFTPAQHPSLSHPLVGHALDFPADLAVRLPDNPYDGGAQWIPRDALLYAEEQFARGAEGAEPLPELHSAAPPMAEILADARTRPVFWVDYGNGFPRSQQTSSTTSGSQSASRANQPIDHATNLPTRFTQNGSAYSLDALGWTSATQQPAENVQNTQHVSGEGYRAPPGYPINYTLRSGQEQTQPDSAWPLRTDFGYTASECAYTSPGQLPLPFTQADIGLQGHYGLSNSLPVANNGRARGGDIPRYMRSAPHAFNLDEEDDWEPQMPTPTPAPHDKRGSGKGNSSGTKTSRGRVTKTRQGSARGAKQKRGPRSSARGKDRYDEFVEKHRKRLENGTADQIAREPQEALDRIAPIAPNGPVPRTSTELNNFLENFWSRGGLAIAMAAGATTTSTAAENSIGGNSLSDRAASDGVYDEGDVFDDDDGEFDDEFPAEEDEDAPGDKQRSWAWLGIIQKALHSNVIYFERCIVLSRFKSRSESLCPDLAASDRLQAVVIEELVGETLASYN
ncbi:uncharacterized protein MYCFIDRAFT_178846 [Pseudocercospora fijiensis CIRAD86]|uniref:Uncharacterized protein n=1 Tax=Pseudocercospora fijiensis (strain CIRAD86) TaxID=383855 RepID=M3ANR2_PSEFD|nr:uncharacterized protein MYCFIDRAFT_178846 [Pseudocercospora fijiensis CIRAD86]EME78738.1 hypothetical protein MYCFIDRAFT_178846 [Pseudocercospora fijiensis CIRAD86]